MGIVAERAYAISITNPLGSKDFPELIGKITTGLIAISAPIVAVLVLVGGFQIMTSQGNTEKVEGGRKTITYAMVGFGIILLAKFADLIVRGILDV